MILRCFLALGVGCLIVGGLPNGWAWSAEGMDIGRARQAIQGDWYDKQRHGFSPPRLRELEDHPLRTGGRLAGPAWNWEFPRFPAIGLPFSFANLFTSILILGLLIWLIYLLLNRTRSVRRVLRAAEDRAVELDPGRVEDLPFSVERLIKDPLSEARSLADSGDYDRAIIYLYGYQLLALDQSRKILLQKGKTNRMYLQELKPFPRLKNLLGMTMLRFEHVYFGKHSIDRQEFEQVWATLNEFHHWCQANPTDAEPTASASSLVAETLS